MSDTPKFEVIDRRKKRAEDESASVPAQPAETPTPGAGPRLVVTESAKEKEEASAPQAENEEQIPEPPTAEESAQQKTAYDASAQRLEDLLRAQNPAMGAQPPVTFENLIQQFYVSAMIQMGAGTQEGQRPRVDILGARNTIDLLGILAEKTRGNRTDKEDKMLESALFEARMAFLELTSMISLQGVQAPPPQNNQ